MLLTISLFTITITSIVLSYYLHKEYNKAKELELKLKITRDYANKKAEETFVHKAKNVARQEAKKATNQVTTETTATSTEEQVAPKKSRSRGRRKKPTNV